MKNYMFSLSVLLSCAAAVSTFAAKLGDPAAPLITETWAKGEAVDVRDGKNVYVIELWAMRYKECRDRIPMLSDLQKKFKDKGVVVIGVTHEYPPEVISFVKEYTETLKKEISYAVAVDKEKKTFAAYLDAFGVRGLPHTFIVGKDGKVLWHASPQADLKKTQEVLEKVLEDILAGKYDLAAAMKQDAPWAELAEYHLLAREQNPKAKELGQKMLNSQTNVDWLVSFSYGIITDDLNKKRDFALAEEAVDKAEKVTGSPSARSLLVRGIARFETGKQDEGMGLVKKALDISKDAREKERLNRCLQTMTARKATMDEKQKEEKEKNK